MLNPSFAIPALWTTNNKRVKPKRDARWTALSTRQFKIQRRAFLAAAAALGGGALAGVPAANPSNIWNPRNHNVLFDSTSGSFIPTSHLQNLLDHHRGKLFDRCIIAGEIHDRPRTHAAQLAVLQSAIKLDERPLVVGFEQFYRAHNPFLNSYSTGKISLNALLKVTQWNNTWGYDPELYAPLFRWCRVNNVQMVGLNVPRRLVSFVSQYGLEGLSPELRAFLPKDIDTTNEAHFNEFIKLIGLNAHNLNSRGSDMRQTVWKWFESQVVWDEFMSETVLQTCEKMPNARVVALIGSGHVENRVGFPNRVEKRLGERPLTMVPREVRWVTEEGFPMPDIEKPEQGVSDIIWYTNRLVDNA